MKSAVLVLALSAMPWQVSAQLIDTGATETFNGVATSPDGNLTVLVGPGGRIVHLTPEASGGQVMVSGTDADLFDVHVVSPDFAVVSGFDVVLTWDGTVWTLLLDDDFSSVNTPVWATPERDIILYRTACRVPPGVPQDRFCRLFNNVQALNFCGDSDDVKMIVSAGDIWHLDNQLSDPIDPLAVTPLFDQPFGQALDLNAAWIPLNGCPPGPTPPDSAVGIADGPELYLFQDNMWVKLDPTFPADHTLTWLGGTGLDNVILVGSKPSATSPGTNEGVIWRCDATGSGSCSEVSDALQPPGTLGHSDIAVTQTYQGCVFKGNFEQTAAMDCEQPPTSCQPGLPGRSGECTQATIAGEDGQALAFGSELMGLATTDVAVSMEVVPDFFAEGEDVRVFVSLRNIGAQTATNVRFTLYSASTALTSDCDGGTEMTAGRSFLWTIAAIPPGDVERCEVTGPAPFVATANAFVGAPTDRDTSNNRVRCFADSTGVSGCTLANVIAGN